MPIDDARFPNHSHTRRLLFNQYVQTVESTFSAIMAVMLFFFGTAMVLGAYVGNDFQNPLLLIVSGAMATIAVSIHAFVVQRRKKHSLKVFEQLERTL